MIKFRVNTVTAYFCAMKTRTLCLCLLLLAACKDKPADKPADKLARDEMPQAVQQLFGRVDQLPDSTGLRLQLVDKLDSMGAYQQAMGQMKYLLRRDSLNYGLWFRTAQLQENLHDTPGALRSYRYAIRVYPAPDAMLASANLLAEKKDSAALAICRQVNEMRMGREYTAHCNFISGVYYARTGNKQKAMDAFNTCIVNDHNYYEAYMEKGFLFFDDKKFTDALHVFQTLVMVKNSYADGYYWIAKCDEALNNRADAITNYRQALTLDPGIKEAEAALKRLGAS